MPIVSHVLEQSTQANGGTHNVLRMYDGDGKEYMISFFAAVGVDVNAIITSRKAAMDEQLAQSEFEQIVGL
jgi:hypothetical protein